MRKCVNCEREYQDPGTSDEGGLFKLCDPCRKAFGLGERAGRAHYEEAGCSPHRAKVLLIADLHHGTDPGSGYPYMDKYLVRVRIEGIKDEMVWEKYATEMKDDAGMKAAIQHAQIMMKPKFEALGFEVSIRTAPQLEAQDRLVAAKAALEKAEKDISDLGTEVE